MPPRHAAFKGEVSRIVFKTLRTADGPVTSRDIALRLMEERSLNPSDKELSVIMVKVERLIQNVEREVAACESASALVAGASVFFEPDHLGRLAERLNCRADCAWSAKANGRLVVVLTYSMIGMPLNVVGGGPPLQCQVPAVRIMPWVT